jgi:hypothetical protein
MPDQYVFSRQSSQFSFTVPLKVRNLPWGHPVHAKDALSK